MTNDDFEGKYVYHPAVQAVAGKIDLFLTDGIQRRHTLVEGVCVECGASSVIGCGSIAIGGSNKRAAVVVQPLPHGGWQVGLGRGKVAFVEKACEIAGLVPDDLREVVEKVFDDITAFDAVEETLAA